MERCNVMSPLLKKRSPGGEKNLLRKYCLISGLLAMAIMLFTYLCHNNTLTFGANTVLRMDLYHQYGPLYAELYDRIVNGYSLVYSWTSGLGGSFIGNLFNYCCSPFALVILLTGHQNMPDAIAVMILLNAVMSAMTFTYYINRSSGTVSRISIGFSLLYTFSGYFVAYSWNIMWLDAMAMFPLVILGVERIIQQKKPALYIFAMTFTMITNYYMAYMVCILSALYFLYYYTARYEFAAPMFRRKAAEAPAPAAADGFEIIAPAPTEAPRSDEAAADTGARDAAAEAAAIESAVTEGSAAIDAALDAAVTRQREETDISGGFTVSDEALQRPPVAAREVPAGEEEALAAPELFPAGEAAAPLTEDAPPSEEAAAAPEAPSLSAEAPQGPVFSETPQAVDGAFAAAFAEHAQTGSKKRTRRRSDKPKKEKVRLSERRFWVTGWTFALASVLCFMLSAFALIPVWYCLQTSSATGGTFPTDMKIYFNLFDFVANHLPDLTTTIRSSGDIVLPNVYCGLLTLLLLPLYFFSDRVAGRKKIAAAVLIGVFYISFSVNYFNFIWHGMHMPNDLPFRYSFGYSFLLLTLAYRVFLNIDEFSNRIYVGVGVGAVAFVLLVSKLGSQNVGTKTINIVLIFAVVYVVLLGLLRSRRFERGAVVSLLIIAIVTELCVSDVSNFVMQQPKANYVSDYPAYQQIKEATEGEDDALFYRTEISKLRARMDPCWYGYRGVSTFSSMAYEHVAKLMESLGLFGNDINSYTYYPQTPVFNSMFALKYIYDNNNLVSENDYYEKVASNDSFTSYRYKYALPLGFAVNDGIEEWDRSSDDPFTVQNDLMAKATGVSGILVPAEVTDVESDNISEAMSPALINSMSVFNISKSNNGSDAEFIVKLDVTEPGQYYVYTGSTHISSITVNAEDFSYSYASSSVQPFTLDLGYQSEGAQIRIRYELTDDNSASVDFSAVRIDAEQFQKAYDAIRKNGLLTLDSFEETALSGTIRVTGADKLLYTSIPFDESWAVFVDGQYVSYDSGDIVKVGDALLGVRLSSGEHTVKFLYQARGLSTGVRMSALGLLIVALWLAWRFFLSDKLPKKLTGRLSRRPDWEIK